MPAGWKNRKRFRKGRRITSLASAARYIESGRWLYLRDKVQHPSWLRSMTLHTIGIYVKGGSCRLAVENKEGKTR